MDQVFHRAMAAACGNKLIEKQVILLHNNASRFWFFGLPRFDARALKADLKAHLDVVDAIGDAMPLRPRRRYELCSDTFPRASQCFSQAR